MIRKIIAVVLSIMLCSYSFIISPNNIFADDDDACEYGDDKNAYYDCLKERREKLDKEIEEASKNKNESIALANKYAESIDELKGQIDVLVPQIEELEVKIELLEDSIEENEKKVEELKNRILKRMKSAQATMHFNPYLDFILGSNGFADMLRRSYGVEAITQKEENDRNVLIDILNQLEADKKECSIAKDELDRKKEDLEAKKQEAEIKQEYFNKIANDIQKQIDELQNEQAMYDMKIDYIDWNLEDLLEWDVQNGFMHPVPGASISAGIPYYPASFGGGMHIGIDYAAGYGTSILSPADGVIIASVNACENDRGYHLGDTCGYVEGKGMAAGGNQIRMMFSVNGYMYGLIGFHMLYGSVHSEGAIKAGTIIGQVGSSGNSTGAHCHIELFYLGKGDPKDIPNYLGKGYTVGFNLGYNLSSLCSNKGSAPCRLDGRDFFGYSNVTPYSYLIG